MRHVFVISNNKTIHMIDLDLKKKLVCYFSKNNNIYAILSVLSEKSLNYDHSIENRVDFCIVKVRKLIFLNFCDGMLKVVKKIENFTEFYKYKL